jgi:hypothetical protein
LIWPAIIATSAIATVLASLGEGNQPLRSGVAFWFLLVCPGMAFVRLLGLSEPFSEWAVAVALSVALDTVVGEVLLFAGAWSAASGLTALAALSIGGAALQVGRSVRRGPSAARPHPVESSR